MAIARTGPLVQAISGRLGGAIFAITRRGQQIKKLPTPTNQDTINRIASQRILQQAANAWAAISAERQLTWKTFAAFIRIPDRLGQTRSLTGRTAFIRYQTLFLRFSATPFALPPTGASQPNNFDPQWTLDASQLHLELTFDPNTLQLFALIQAARHWGSNVLKRQSWTTIGIRAFTPILSTFNFKTAIEASIGMPAAGELISIRTTLLFTTPFYINPVRNIQTISY